MRYASESAVPSLIGRAVLVVALVALSGCRRHPTAGGAAPTRLVGHVLSANGRPLAGARAVLERETSTTPIEVASVAVDPGGDFVLEHLPAGRYLLRTE